MILRKTYYGGTHRLLAPEDTLAKIEPHLSAIGVTRCADVTGLDRIGIPVFCAIRPQGRIEFRSPMARDLATLTRGFPP